MRLEASGKMWMPDRGVLAGSASHMLQYRATPII